MEQIVDNSGPWETIKALIQKREEELAAAKARVHELEERLHRADVMRSALFRGLDAALKDRDALLEFVEAVVDNEPERSDILHDAKALLGKRLEFGGKNEQEDL